LTPALDCLHANLYLETVERARHFMLANYQREVMLSEIARHAFVSDFH